MIFRREIQEIGLPFLDVICCGFGAIILLLMITKISLPMVLEETLEDLQAVVQEKDLSLDELLGEIDLLERALVESEADLDILIPELERLQIELLEITERYNRLTSRVAQQEATQADLARAKQSLTDEMATLLGTSFRRQNNTIGGITVDSEYIIFVIDTSGSMQTVAWPLVIKKVSEVLNIYPNVKGIQVMNDMGDYMFPQTRGQWMEDSPTRRRQIVNRLRNWTIFSNSSPVEGIRAAIGTFYDPEKLISIYVFGDDFQGNSVEEVVDEIDQVNIAGEGNERRVRIHAVGFPVYFDSGFAARSVYLFTLLMKELSYRNNGTFVALPRIRR